MISVPIVIEPPASSFSPANSTATVATAPRNSIDGKKMEKIFCV